MDIPPALINILDDWPIGLIVFFVVALLGVPFATIVAAVINWITSRRNQNITSKISDKEAETHRFSATLDGFQELLLAQKAEMVELRNRIESLETHESGLIDHVYLLESLVPTPPGRPARPSFMQPRLAN